MQTTKNSIYYTKILHTGDTDSLDLCQKLNNKLYSVQEHIPFFKALCWDDPEQSAGTILASNPEHLPVSKAPREDNLEQNAGTNHASNPEYLPHF